MDIVAKINENNSFGGNFYTKDIQEDWNITNVIYDSNYLKPIWNISEWVEGATQEEIEAYNRSLIPQEISRMKFELQLYITTTIRDENNNILQFGKTFQDIIDYIDSLQMSSLYKNLLIIRLKSCVTLERDNDDLNALAPGMGISQAQLDEIFINGNSLS